MSRGRSRSPPPCSSQGWSRSRPAAAAGHESPSPPHDGGHALQPVDDLQQFGLGANFASAHNCQALAGLAAKAAAAVEASGNSTNALQTEATELQALAKAAPSDISGDFQTFATAFTGFLHALQSSGYKLGSKTPPTAAQAAALATAAKSFDTPKLKQAEQHLSAWARQNCSGVGG